MEGGRRLWVPQKNRWLRLCHVPIKIAFVSGRRDVGKKVTRFEFSRTTESQFYEKIC